MWVLTPTVSSLNCAVFFLISGLINPTIDNDSNDSNSSEFSPSTHTANNLLSNVGVVNIVLLCL